MRAEELLSKLKALSDPEAVAGMARFGINPAEAYGVSISNLRKLAKEIGRDRLLAQELWSSGVHEARILASMIDDPKAVTEAQLESWAKEFNSWDICDQCCNNLFAKTRFAYRKAIQWSNRGEEFVKRAGFALMAQLAVHDKRADDSEFMQFLYVISREAVDDRNFVKKAVNWALRSIGKRNIFLNRMAIETARKIEKMDFRSSRWIASDALRELTGEAVRKGLRA
jgi:3-methyladenine DNA glycosylase AlkD